MFKTSHVLPALFAMLLFLGCAKTPYDTTVQSASLPEPQSVVAVSLTSDAPTESAHVSSVMLVCGEERQALSFDEIKQSSVVAKDLSACNVELQTFVVTLDGAPLTYTRTDRTVDLSVAYDATIDGEVVGVRLVSGTQTFVDGCLEGCQGGHLNAAFSYSELLGETISLEHDFEIPTVARCHLEAELICQKGHPRLAINFSACRVNVLHQVQFGYTTAAGPIADAAAHALIDAGDLSFDPRQPFRHTLSVGETAAVIRQQRPSLLVALRFPGTSGLQRQRLRSPFGALHSPATAQSPNQHGICR